jgi:choline dehydrogenase-like flavoprotein
MNIEYDLIIIGYGTTSSCIIHQLRNSNLKILVLNQGPLIEDENVRLLKNFNTVWKNPKYTNIVGISETNNNVTQGRIMGGSSMHNGCVAIKPTKMFIGDIDYELPIEINSKPNSNPLSQLIVESISNIFNIPVVVNHNEHDFSISTQSQMFVKTNGERSMVTDLLKGLPDNIEVIEGTCLNLILKNNKITGVNSIINGKNIVLNSKTIVVSAGINSSVILERSGIGSKNILDNANIKCILNNSNIGNNVKNQVGPSICIRFPETYMKDLQANELGVIGMGFTSKDNERKFQIMVTKYPFISESISKLFDLNGTISINICDLKPKSSGSIHIVSSNFDSQPLIDLKTYSDQEDIESGIESLQYMYHIYEEIKKTIPEVELVFPTFEMLNNIDTKKILEIDSLVTEHYTSSCRIGNSIDNSVVDPNFKVHGIEGLYICDASVFPYCPDGNPQYSCMLLGLRLGEMFNSQI